MTEEQLKNVMDDFKKGKNFFIIKNIRALEESVPQIRRAIIQEMGMDLFKETMQANRKNQNALLNNTIAQINYLVNQTMTLEQLDDFEKVLEGTLIELGAKKDLLP